MTTNEGRERLLDILDQYGNLPTYWLTVNGDCADWDNKYVANHLAELSGDDDIEWLVDTGDGHVNPVEEIAVYLVKPGRKNQFAVSEVAESIDRSMKRGCYLAVHFRCEFCKECC